MTPRPILAIARLTLLICLGMVSLQARALTLKIGIYDQKPDAFVDEAGQPAGILGQLLKEIARQEGWTLHTASCSWQQCMHWLQDGTIDVLPDVYFSPARAETLGFHHIAALHSWSQMYTRPGSKIQAITDLSGLTVAVLAGSAQQDYLTNALKGLGVDARLAPVQRLEEGFQMVQQQHADTVAADFYVGELTARDYGLVHTPLVFQPTQAFFATRKGMHPEVLAAIDKHLALWQANPQSFYFRILNQWRAPVASAQRTDNAFWLAAGLAPLLAIISLTAGWLLVRSRRQCAQLRTSERRLNVILDSIDAIVSIKSPDGRYTFANHTLESFMGVGLGQVAGHTDADFITDKASLDCIQQSDRAIVETRSRTVVQQTLRRPDTQEARNFISIKAPLLATDGTVEAIGVVATDVTDRLQAEQAVQYLSSHDHLTKLPNRRKALEHLQSLMARTTQDDSYSALILLDLDNFQHANEALGYGGGDQILIEVGTRLKHAARTDDLVAHTSADEFVVLARDIGSNAHEAAHTARQLADHLRQSISAHPIQASDHPVLVTASVGLTLIHRASQSLDQLMNEAEMATLRAREQGGNQSTFYEHELQAEVEQRQWVERDLLQALNTPQLSLHLQPQFGHSGQVTGAELLARWQHPEHGAVSPAQFIPIAEESGLINLLGAWTLDTACTTLSTLQALGETYPLSINISPRQLMDATFVETVSDTLARRQVPGNRLIFEITEGLLIRDILAVAKRMQVLARMGIRFSIDDFGTGYSNLASLKRLPLYELKIDKSLIQDLPGDIDSLAIVQMILAMADQLNLRVVAEGVETGEQSELLFEHECHAVQGYLLARPMPISHWIERVRQRQANPDIS
ncbi:EAL domain-containing protein [Castellaniella sp.]|uniref:EAL domain-containing protein n=1 Tax=Castellaniella sp. TaxID=1955812 RepID=UPI003A90F76B